MQDILLDTNYDLQIVDGDFAVGDSDEQNQQLLLVCNKGDFKQYPDRCVGISNWLKDDDKTGMLGEIKKEFERDGMVVKLVQMLNDKLNIDAHY